MDDNTHHLSNYRPFSCHDVAMSFHCIRRGVVDEEFTTSEHTLSRLAFVVTTHHSRPSSRPDCNEEEILVSVTGTGDFGSSPDLILTEDFTGVNAGVLFFRRSTWSFEFLNTWWNQTAFVRFGSSKSGDNDALKHLIRRLPPDQLQRHVRIAPMQCLFNSYPWNPTWKSTLRFLSSPSTIWKGAGAGAEAEAGGKSA
ncbi:hypothetical protein ACLOJK_024464 [Asimina triloba]